MEVQFAVAKVSKWASRESGDTLEMIERPHGGLSMVLVDGQTSGRSAKAISNLVARKAIQLLGEGVRDGAAARAAHDYLYTYRGGKVSATLNILSVDILTKTIVISRNNESPVLVRTTAGGYYQMDGESKAVGVHRNTKPVIAEIPIEIGTIVVAFTDGLRHAGSLSGKGAVTSRLPPFSKWSARGCVTPMPSVTGCWPRRWRWMTAGRAMTSASSPSPCKKVARETKCGGSSGG